MKITLINPPFLFPVKEEIVLSQCLGLRYIASYLKAKGTHEIDFIDALNLGFSNVQKYANGFIVGLNTADIIKLIPRDTDLIGISVPFSQLAPIAHDIIDGVKALFPAIPVVMGGVYPSTQPRLALSSQADMIVVGEGEQALSRIAEGADTKDIRGVYTLENIGDVSFPAADIIKDLDTIPFPDDSLRGVEKYFSISPRNEKTYRTAALITSRGCPFHCEFCSVHPVYGHTWRGRSPGNVLSEIEYLHNKYGINCLEIEDDNFTLQKQRTVEILEGIIRFNEKGWNLNWRTPNGVRIDTIDADVAKLIKASNCREIVVALEHGDEEILRIMNKQIDLQKAYDVLRILVEHEIPKITVFVMVGYPGETARRFQNGLKFLEKVKKLGGPLSVWVNITQPYPGTPLLERCKNEGYLSDCEIDNFLIKKDLMSTGYSIPITTADFDSEEVRSRKQAICDVFNDSKKDGNVKILLCGWYFQGNTGDDLSIEPIAAVLKKYGELQVTTTAVFDQGLIDWCDILVIGSGSHITPRGISCYQHVKYAKDNGKKIVFYSQTIEDGHPLFQEHLSRADLITVRDSKSKEVVEAHGFRAVIAADPIFIKKRRTIGISFRSWVNEPADVIGKLAAALDNLALDYDLIFMPFTEAKTDTESDASFHERIFQSMKNKPHKGSYVDNVEKVDLLIGMRLHALITALNMGKPVLAIDYDAKVRRIFSDLALKDRVVSYNEICRIPQIVREKIFSSDKLALREKVNGALIAVMCADVRGEKKPAISVVMPSYNRSVLLKEAIDSIVRQSFSDWELVLIDDGSTDDTESIVRSYTDGRIRYYNFGHNGISYSRNIGNLLSRGDIIAVADSDDINLPNRLDVSYKAITEGKADIVYSSMFHLTSDGHRELIPSQPFSAEKLHQSNFIYHPTVAYRREVALQCPYSEDLEMVEDYQMYLQAAGKGYSFHQEEEPLILHRIHDGQISSERSDEMAEIHEGLVNSKGRVGEHKADSYLPLVSVIMPTYNRPEMLKEAIRSVLSQSYHNFEIIVVNDAGADVADVIKAFHDERLVYVSHEENKGLPAARNSALRIAKGEYIAYLDDDDVYYPNHLEVLAGYLKKGPSKVAYTDSCQVFQSWISDRYVTLKKEVLYSRDFDRETLFVGNYIPVLNVMHRKDLLEEAGYFDEALDAHEDWDLWIRFARHSDFYHIKEITAAVSMRMDGTTMTSSNREPFLQTMELIHDRYADLVRDPQVIKLKQQAQDRLKKEIATNKHTSIIRDYQRLHFYQFAGEFVMGREVLVVDRRDGSGAEFLAETAASVVCLCESEALLRRFSHTHSRVNLRFKKDVIMTPPGEKDRHYDVVVYIEDRQYADNDENLVAHIKRHLKEEGGVLILGTPQPFCDASTTTPNQQGLQHAETAFNYLNGELKRQFKEVYVYGQQVYPFSSLFPFFASSGTKKEYAVQRKDDQFQFMPGSLRDRRPGMFVVVAGDHLEESAIPGDTSLVDLSNTWMKLKDDHIQNLTTDVEERTAWAQSLVTQVEELQRVQKEYADRAQLLASELNEVRQTSEAYFNRAHSLDEKLKNQQVKLSLVQNQLDEMCQSTSWRVTYPFRSLGTAIKTNTLFSSGYRIGIRILRNIYYQVRLFVLPGNDSGKRTDEAVREDAITTVQHSNPGRTTITAFIPYNFVPQTFGGGMRIMNIYDDLSNHFNINLVGIVGYGDKFTAMKINDNFTVYLVPMSRKYYDYMIDEQKKAEGLLHDILLTDEYKMMPNLVELCNQLVPKTDIFVSSQPYFMKMLLEFCSSKILIYDAQNVDYDLKKSYFKNPVDNVTAKRYLDSVREAEALACRRSDFILGVSNEDVENLCRIYEVDKEKFVMVPNGIDVHACHFISDGDRAVNKERIEEKRKQVVFVGSAHGPNIEAVEFILNEIAEKNRDIKYTIIGNLQSIFNDRKIPSNVHFTGMISAEAKESIYKIADAAINPMFSGSGTNLKVLEYIAYGIPLISTKFGMRGFDVFDKFIYFADKTNFLETIEETLSLPMGMAENNARQARKICAENFDKTVINLDLIDKIRKIEIKHDLPDNKYKIAIDGRILHRNITGSERYIYELVRNIRGRDQKCEHHYCLVNNTGFKIEGVSNIPYISLDENVALFHRTYQVSNYNDLLELLIAKKSIFSFLDLILCKNPDYFRRKEDHDNYVELMSLALNLSDRIIAISEHAKQDVIDNFNIPEEKIDVVYLGLDLNKFRVVTDRKTITDFKVEYNLPEKYLLYVGTDYPHKNLKNLYIAFSEIMDLPEMKEYSLVVAGTSYYRNAEGYLESYLKPIKHRFISLGHFADEKIHLLYNGADIFVFPSLYEGFGLTVLEAMACGVPLVCSNSTSLPEVAGDAAYMVNAKDPDAIAKAIVDIVADRTLRSTLIEKGLERVKQFTWQKCAENTYAVYDKLLKEQARGKGYDEEKLRLLLSKIMDNNMVHLRQNNKPVMIESPGREDIFYLAKLFADSVRREGMPYSTKLAFNYMTRRLRK